MALVFFNALHPKLENKYVYGLIKFLTEVKNIQSLQLNPVIQIVYSYRTNDNEYPYE